MIVLTSVGIFILPGIILINSTVAYGQSKESGRDPFLLPSGVHLLSNKDTAMGTKGIPSKLAGNPSDVPSFSLEGQGHFDQ